MVQFVGGTIGNLRKVKFGHNITLKVYKGRFSLLLCSTACSTTGWMIYDEGNIVFIHFKKMGRRG